MTLLAHPETLTLEVRGQRLEPVFILASKQPLESLVGPGVDPEA
jgi:hypothetical protein